MTYQLFEDLCHRQNIDVSGQPIGGRITGKVLGLWEIGVVPYLLLELVHAMEQIT